MKSITGESLWDTQARHRADRGSILIRFFYRIVTHHFFNFIIFMLIIFNTVVLASDDYPQSK